MPPADMTDDVAPQAEDDGPAPARRWMLWLVLVAVALLFVAMGLRRTAVNVLRIEERGEQTYAAILDACKEQSKVTVAETADRVTITASKTRSFCAGGQTLCSVTVQFSLDEPLGGRPVFDGNRDVRLDVIPAPAG